jgi:hypothetical protein
VVLRQVKVNSHQRSREESNPRKTDWEIVIRNYKTFPITFKVVATRRRKSKAKLGEKGKWIIHFPYMTGLNRVSQLNRALSKFNYAMELFAIREWENGEIDFHLREQLCKLSESAILPRAFASEVSQIEQVAILNCRTAQQELDLLQKSLPGPTEWAHMFATRMAPHAMKTTEIPWIMKPGDKIPWIMISVSCDAFILGRRRRRRRGRSQKNRKRLSGRKMLSGADTNTTYLNTPYLYFLESM